MEFHGNTLHAAELAYLLKPGKTNVRSWVRVVSSLRNELFFMSSFLSAHPSLMTSYHSKLNGLGRGLILHLFFGNIKLNWLTFVLPYLIHSQHSYHSLRISQIEISASAPN